eukprot:m.184969 g.184969  ORF g.184969 m.184969 type:complete len:104 (+) comp15564_c1_seq6:1973-2284(+)
MAVKVNNCECLALRSLTISYKYMQLIPSKAAVDNPYANRMDPKNLSVQIIIILKDATIAEAQAHKPNRRPWIENAMQNMSNGKMKGIINLKHQPAFLSCETQQ